MIRKQISAVVAAMFVSLANKKLWATVIGVTALQALYWHSAYWLITTVPVEKVAAYESMFQTNHYAIVLAILSFLGVQGAVDVFRRNVSSATSIASTILNERRESKDEKIITHRIIEEGSPEAPARKPWSMITDES